MLQFFIKRWPLIRHLITLFSPGSLVTVFIKKGRRKKLFFIGPESDHWLCLSLTHSCSVNLIDVTLACEDGNSKLVEVINVVDVDNKDCVGNSLLQIRKLKFGHKA